MPLESTTTGGWQPQRSCGRTPTSHTQRASTHLPSRLHELSAAQRIDGSFGSTAGDAAAADASGDCDGRGVGALFDLFVRSGVSVGSSRPGVASGVGHGATEHSIASRSGPHAAIDVVPFA